ncbi:MAG: hypothetical protein LBQ88_05255 [Treponema sp.]|nr:hypothetical protein [Treponema sp.]
MINSSYPKDANVSPGLAQRTQPMFFPAILRRILSIQAILTFFFLAIPVVNGEDTGRNIRLQVYYAYSNPCELCDDEGEFISFFNEETRDFPNRPELFFSAFNVFRPGLEQSFINLCAQLGIDSSVLPLPVLIIGDEYLAGEEAINKGARDLFFRQAEAARTDVLPVESASMSVTEPAAGNSPKRGGAEVLSYPPVSPGASTLICFVTTACESCEKTKAYLGRLPAGISLIDGKVSPVEVRYFNVAEGEGLAAIRQFFESYAVPKEDQIVPIVFYTGGYLSGYANIQSGVQGVLPTGKALNFAYPKTGGSVQGFTPVELPAIFLAGLLGGLNPCSISMLLLLLSLLAAKSAHILALGLSYVSSRMITYLALGLSIFAFARLLDTTAFQAAQGIVRWIIIALSLGLCLLNVADFINARRENYGAIKVQLPKALRRFNNNTIKKVAGGPPRFLMAAIFLLGIIVSAGEFLCTGQIYLAAIIYLLRTDTGSFPLTFTALLCYTLAAALPPALLVVLCYRGRKTFDLSEFVRGKMPLIKIANAVLFALFALFAFLYY